MFNPESLPDNISVMVSRVMESDNLGVKRCHRLAAKAATDGNSWDELTWLAGAVSIVYPNLDSATLGYVATELALRANREA